MPGYSVAGRKQPRRKTKEKMHTNGHPVVRATMDDAQLRAVMAQAHGRLDKRLARVTRQVDDDRRWLCVAQRMVPHTLQIIMMVARTIAGADYTAPPHVEWFSADDTSALSATVYDGKDKTRTLATVADVALFFPRTGRQAEITLGYPATARDAAIQLVFQLCRAYKGDAFFTGKVTSELMNKAVGKVYQYCNPVAAAAESMLALLAAHWREQRAASIPGHRRPRLPPELWHYIYTEF